MKLAILSLSLGPLIRSENKKLQRSQGLSRDNSFSPLNLPSLPFFPAFQMDRPTPGHCRSLLSYRRGVSPSGTENPAEMQSFLLPFPLVFSIPAFLGVWIVHGDNSRVFLAPESRVSNLPWESRKAAVPSPFPPAQRLANCS